MTTRTGRTFYVAASREEALTAPEGSACFTPDELRKLKALPPEVAALTIDIKEVFGNDFAVVEVVDISSLSVEPKQRNHMHSENPEGRGCYWRKPTP